MISSKKRLILKKLNISSQKIDFFGGSESLDPIAYKTFEVNQSKSATQNLFMSVESHLSEMDEMFGQLSYIHRELNKSLKK